MSLSVKPVISKRPFVLAAYTTNDHGIPKPRKPTKCPNFSETRCIIHIERWRERKCGIPYLLSGMRCVTHHVSFTVYPPGWVPYGRKQLILVDHNGAAVEAEKGLSSWEETVFEATLDAAKGQLWPEEVQLGPLPEVGVRPQSRRTQRRHVAGAMKLFGLSSAQSVSEREVVSYAIQIGVSRLEEGTQRIRAGPSLVMRGVEGVRVLEQLPNICLLMSGLLTLGVNQGYWGPALLQH